MFKGPKKKLYDWEEKIVVKPSTRHGSAIVNNAAFLVTYAITCLAVFLVGLVVIWFSFWLGLLMVGFPWICSRFIDLAARGKVKVDRKAAKELIRLETAYSQMPKEKRNEYRSYLEAAYTGDASMDMVQKLFMANKAVQAQKVPLLDAEVKAAYDAAKAYRDAQAEIDKITPK